MSIKYPTKDSTTKLAQIARKDYMKKNNLDDDDEDEDNDDGEGYNIDPSSNMWKPIEFGKSYSKKNIVSSFKTSTSDTKLPNLPNVQNNSSPITHKIFPDIKDQKNDPKAAGSALLPLVAIPKPIEPPKKRSPRMSKQETDEVNSLVQELQQESKATLSSPIPPVSSSSASSIHPSISLTPIKHPPHPLSSTQSTTLAPPHMGTPSSLLSSNHQKELNELLKEKELMKQKISMIEKEKSDMEKLTSELASQLTTQQQAQQQLQLQQQLQQQQEEMRKKLEEEATQVELLTKEKEEMKKFILQMKLNKDEELSQLIQQKNSEKQSESELLKRDRELLRNELEQMRIQNELLIKQMKSTQQAQQQAQQHAQQQVQQAQQQEQQQQQQHKEEIELIHNLTLHEVTKLEEKNKILTENLLLKQAESEKKLLQEKDELKLALQRMENEKLSLSNKIYSIEMTAKKETNFLLKQQHEYEKKLKEMEEEKNKLYELVAKNEIKLQTSSEEITNQLKEELTSLTTQLLNLESDKKNIEQNMKSTENNTQLILQELSQKLDHEREEYQQKLHQMEMEKLEIAKLLIQREQEAKEYAKEVQEQLKKEQDEMEATKRQIHEERVKLEMMLQEVNKKRDQLENEVRDEVQEIRKTAKIEVANEVNQVNQMKYELERTLEMIRKEKIEMEMKLKEAAELAIQRERELAEQASRERDELRKAVERMREEMEEEKRRREEEKKLQDESLALASTSTLSPQPKRLDSSSSLYNMLEEEGSSSRSEKSFRHHRSHATMVPIAEVGSHDMSDDSPTIAVQEEISEIHNPSQIDEPVEPSTQSQLEETPQQIEESSEPDEFVDLPLPHAAAARGDLSSLKSLENMDSSLLSSFDSAGRTPLFYAVAYNHTMVTSYLMDASPECIFQTDCHGDAPLHAAASAGSVHCVELIIRAMAERGVDGVDIRNNMGMTPAHLASNVEVLSMLHAAGADLSITDNNNRTVLFVAAAMNRKDCVQYLLDCFDSLREDDEGNIIYLADNRGDTPLHAAACNGAEESLLLLLQCGISPLMLNHRGLKAIDLAQKNKRKKCREILAQYHLHFATTSDFDSVLFIAALEGQKKVQDAMMNALSSPEDQEGYNIIKNCHIENLQEDEVRH